MKKLVFIGCISALITGCVGAQTKSWSSGSGLTNENGAYEVLNSKNLEITVSPLRLGKSALTVFIKIRNNGSETQDIDISNIKLKTATGALIDQLTEQEIINELNSANAMAGMIAGGNRYSDQYAASSAVKDVLGKMIKSGKLPSKTEKQGVIYFDGQQSKGNFSIYILKPLLDSDTEVPFYFKNR